MPAISHLASLGFNTGLSENLSKAFITSITESSPLRKNVVLMASAEYKNMLTKVLIPLIFLFSVMKIKAILITRINI